MTIETDTPALIEQYMQRHNITQITKLPAYDAGEMAMAPAYSVVIGVAHYFSETLAGAVGKAQ
jgi:hypothetical protein